MILARDRGRRHGAKADTSAGATADAGLVAGGQVWAHAGDEQHGTHLPGSPQTHAAAWAQGPGPAQRLRLFHRSIQGRARLATGFRGSADAAHVVHDQSVAQADSDDGGPGSHNEGGSGGESDDPGSGGISGEPGRSE